MEENKRIKMEEKLRKMMASENKEQPELGQILNGLSGARVIRRRKGAPDLAIA